MAKELTDLTKSLENLQALYEDAVNGTVVTEVSRSKCVAIFVAVLDFWVVIFHLSNVIFIIGRSRGKWGFVTLCFEFDVIILLNKYYSW